MFMSVYAVQEIISYSEAVVYCFVFLVFIIENLNIAGISLHNTISHILICTLLYRSHQDSK